MCCNPASYDISRQRIGGKKKASGDRKRRKVSESCEWGEQSCKVKGYTRTWKLGRNPIQK